MLQLTKNKNIIGIKEIDTRQLVIILREKGVQSGCIMSENIDEEKALAMAVDDVKKASLVEQVTTKKTYLNRNKFVS